MTITNELIERVARRMCEVQGLDPEKYGDYSGAFYYCPRWRQFRGRAHDAITAHIALAEIMPPNRATLLEAVNKLEWSEQRPPSLQGISYDHVVAESPLGQWSIQWKSWKDYDERSVFLDGRYLTGAGALADAQELAQKAYADLVVSNFAAVLRTKAGGGE